MTIKNQAITVDRVLNNLEPVGAILQNVNGDPIDLTNKTMLFRLVSTTDGSVKIDNRPAVQDPDQVANPGKVTYTPQAGDFDTVEVYAAYFLIDEQSPTPDVLFPYDGPQFLLNVRDEYTVG